MGKSNVPEINTIYLQQACCIQFYSFSEGFLIRNVEKGLPDLHLRFEVRAPSVWDGTKIYRRRSPEVKTNKSDFLQCYYKFMIVQNHC